MEKALQQHLTIIGQGIIANLHFMNSQLAGFAFNFFSSVSIEVWKKENELVISVGYNNKQMNCSTKFDYDFMQEFNSKILQQYSKHVLKQNADERVMKTFLEDLLSYIDRLSDYRFNDILQEAKNVLKEKEIEVYYSQQEAEEITP